MASTQFTEQQTIPSFWRLLIFGGVTLIVAFSAFMVYQTEWNTMPGNEKPFLLTLLLGPIGTLILFFIRLDVRITSSTVEYKVHPFRKRFKVIPFDKISQIELTKPTGIKSFKGVGTRRNFNQTELSFGGKYLVVVTMVKGHVLSFTTNKPQELSSFLKNIEKGTLVVKIDVK